jgi:hypothetical protein
VGLAALVTASGACSFLLDHGSTQCQVNGDCARFGGRPSCQSGVCVDLGELPKDCFYGSPDADIQFANQCSTAECLAFDDCTRVGICKGADPPQPIAPPGVEAGATTGDGGSASAPAVPVALCADPNDGRPKVIYITGSSNFPPLLKKVAPIIIQSGYTPVFLVTNSCTGVKTMLSTQSIDRTISDPPKSATAPKYAQYFDANGGATDCLLGSTQNVDVGESDIFSEDCDPFLPSQEYPTIIESFGPNQAMAFIVNQASQEHSISEDAARVVFGLGGSFESATPPSQPIPWTDPARFFVRNSGTGTQQMIGHAIGLSAKAFWGFDTGTADRVAAIVHSLGDVQAQQGIGIISVDYYDADRANLRALAYRGAGQECAYLPDSDERSFDKRNVRDGHYPIWGPLHFFSSRDDMGAAAAFRNAITVNTMDRQVIDAFVGASLIPACAMAVARFSEIGPLSLAPAPRGCDCYFEAQSAMLRSQPLHLAADCVACGMDGDPACPAGRSACNFGYCEPN